MFLPFAIFEPNAFFMVNIFNLTLRIKGFPMRGAAAKFKKIQSVSEDEYEDFILNKRREIVEFHLKYNKYYREFVGKNFVVNWDELPIMTKKDFQKPLTERL